MIQYLKLFTLTLFMSVTIQVTPSLAQDDPPVNVLPILGNQLRVLDNGFQVFAVPDNTPIVVNPDTGQFFDVNIETGEYYAIDSNTGNVSPIASGRNQVLIESPGSRLDTGNVVVNERLPELTNRLRTLDNGLEVYGRPDDGAIAVNRDTGQVYEIDTATGEYYEINSLTGAISSRPSGSDRVLIAEPGSQLSTGNNLNAGNILRTTADGYQIRSSSDGSSLIAVDPETGTYFAYDSNSGEVVLDNILGTNAGLRVDGFTRLPPEVAVLGQLANGSLRGIDVEIGGVDTAFRIVADQNFDDVFYALNSATGEYFSYDTASRAIDFNSSFGISSGFGGASGSVADSISARPSRVVYKGPSTVVTGAASRIPQGGCGGKTLGGVICNTVESFKYTPSLLAGFAYLCGLILGFIGILKLKDHVESPNQVSIWEPIKRFIAGGMFLSLPWMIEAVYGTIAEGGTVVVGGSRFNLTGTSGGGLDAKLVALMADVWQPMQHALTGFSWLAGLVLILIGISRLLKSEQEGARGPLGIGTIMTFLVAGVLLSLNTTLGAAVTSLFEGNASNYAELAYTQGMDPDAIGHSNAVIGAIIAFVAILGWVSFIRGFFIIRGVAEGNSQASMMAGITHILGGAAAVNLGGIISAVQETLGINTLGLTISSIEPYITTVTMMA